MTVVSITVFNVNEYISREGNTSNWVLPLFLKGSTKECLSS